MIPCTEDSIRLVDGAGNGTGRVELCIGGLWSTICDSGFDDMDAAYVCGKLGFQQIGEALCNNDVYIVYY